MMHNLSTTPFLHFVIGQSLVAWIHTIQLLLTIVQTKTKAVKAMIISYVTVVKHAYQKVSSFDMPLNEPMKLFDKLGNFRKDM